MVIATVQKQLESALDDARSVCSLEGNTSPACAVHWDIVEELHAALAHHREISPKSNSLDQFCAEFPDALECRLYDA